MSVEIGKRLRYARESLRLTLDDIEARTRIQKKYLAAIETGRFDLLPGQIYVRSYVRSYAIAVGENPGALLALLQNQANRNALTANNASRSRLSLPSAGPTGYGNDEPEMTYAPQEERGLSGSRVRETEERAYRSRSERFRQTNAYRAAEEYETGMTEPDETADLGPKRRSPSSRKSALPDSGELGIPAKNDPPVLTRRSSRSEYRNSDKKKGFTFGKLYTILLIIGAILLVIAAVAFMWFRMENASDAKPDMETVQAKIEGKHEAGDRQPILSPLNSSTYGTDRYELVNADKLQLKIKWLKGSGSGYEVRQQEIGSPVAAGEVNPDRPDFSQSFSTGIWLKLFKPNNISVTINNFPVKTDVYTDEKDIYISFVQ